MSKVDEGVDVCDRLHSVCKTNDEGFYRILCLYAREGDTIVDPTYGNGKFWKQVNASLYKAVLTDFKTHAIDLRHLPHDNHSVDVLVLDPPYRYTPLKNKKHEDSPGHGKVDSLYNLQAAKLTNTKAVLELYVEGMIEGHRVLKEGGFLILKCQDTVQDGKQIWVHNILMNKGEELGYACRDLVIVAPPSIIKTRWDKQRHLRKAHSFFLVFRKGGHFPFGIPSVCKK